MSYIPIRDDENETPSQDTTSDRQRADLWSRASPILASFLATGLSVVPAALRWKTKYFDSDTTIYLYTAENRASVQVVVLILSTLFSFLWTYAACTAFNLFMRSRLTNAQIPLDNLRLHISVANTALDMNLPIRLLAFSALWCAAGLVPSWLWTGALTPELTLATKHGLFPVPQPGDAETSILPHVSSNTIWEKADGQWLANGTFHNSPGTVFSSRIIDSIGTASPANDLIRNHTKLDHSGFNYAGRSYGAGASVGLFQPSVSGSVASYTFVERGVQAGANCVYNDTSAWGIFTGPTKFGDTSGVPNVWTANGYRPNEAFDRPPTVNYTVVSFGATPNATVAFSAGSFGGFQNGTAPYYLSIAAGLNYTLLNKVQCELSFKPTSLAVEVDLKNRTIQVMPKDITDNRPRMEAQGELIEWTLKNLRALTMVQTTLYISTIGMAFRDNIQSKIGHPPDMQKGPASSDALSAISDSVTAALDDILEGLNGYALIREDAWSQEDTTIQVSVVQIGNQSYSIALFVFNLVLLAAITFMSIFTRLFIASPAFDFTDLGSMAGAAFESGVSAAKDLKVTHLRSWKGDATDDVLRKSAFVFDAQPDGLGAPTVMVQHLGVTSGRESIRSTSTPATASAKPEE